VSGTVRRAVNDPETGRADAAAMTTSLLAPSSASALARLSREWQVLSTRRALVRQAARWELGVPVRSLDDVVLATGFRAAGGDAGEPSEAGNDVLYRLLLIARLDDLAARAVLQRMLPGLAAIARRWARRSDSTDPVEELIGAAWFVIRTYPVERRPGHLAAQLLRDAEYHAFLRQRRRAAVHELVPSDAFDLDHFAVHPDDQPRDSGVELAELVMAARSSVLSERDLQLLSLLLDSRSPTEVAAAMRVSVRSVSNHRDALVSRLRQTARVLAAA